VKWISSGDKPQRWATKSSIPAHLQRMAVKVAFRWETVWIVRDENRRVLYPSGGWADTFDFYLATPGHVIGLRDLSTANDYEWAQEWRSAMHERIMERAGLPMQAALKDAGEDGV
jgi:hypothetical protein